MYKVCYKTVIWYMSISSHSAWVKKGTYTLYMYISIYEKGKMCWIWASLASHHSPRPLSFILSEVLSTQTYQLNTLEVIKSEVYVLHELFINILRIGSLIILLIYHVEIAWSSIDKKGTIYRDWFRYSALSNIEFQRTLRYDYEDMMK